MSELQVLAETGAIIASIVGSAAGASYWLGRRFASLEARIGRLESSLSDLRNEVSLLSKRQESLETRTGKLESGFSDLRAEVSRLIERQEALEASMRKLESSLSDLSAGVRELGKGVGGLEARMRNVEASLSNLHVEVEGLRDGLRRLGRTVRSTNEFLVDLLGYEGVLRAETVTLAKSEVTRVFELANPLTKEEWARLKELLDKDDLSMEEAWELYRIADKLVEEHGDRLEVWKLLWYSRAWIGINWRRQIEQRKKQQEQAQR